MTRAMTRWDDFLTEFFTPPNNLRRNMEAVEWWVEKARAAWLTDQGRPFFLPARVSGWTYWYAFSANPDQANWVRDLIRAHVASWSIFSGIPIDPGSEVPLDVATQTIVPEGVRFRFAVARDAQAEFEVTDSLQRLTVALESRPTRRSRSAMPLGRLLGDFWDACAAGESSRAADSLADLEVDHRLSRVNRLFLRLQFLAVFEEWDQLAQMESMPDLLRLDRPLLASDALARLAMHRTPKGASPTEFSMATEGFGALVPSTSAIRSRAGAEYYAYWCLATGDGPGQLADRLAAAGWLDAVQQNPALAKILGGAGKDRPTAELDPDDLRRTIDEGRLDAATEMLSQTTPSLDLIGTLLLIVTRTLSPRSIELLQEWRSAVGDVEDHLSNNGVPQYLGDDIALAGKAIADIVQDLIEDGRSSTFRAQVVDYLRRNGVRHLMNPGELAEMVVRLRVDGSKMDQAFVPDLVDLLLDLERDLTSADPTQSSLQDLRWVTLETWALGDSTGDRRRANRVLTLVDRLLQAGVAPSRFDEVVESLRAAWPAFHTDADLAISLEAIELLAAWRPDTGMPILPFASPVLSRIGRHNARRLPRSQLEAATELASEFELDLDLTLSDDEMQGPDSSPQHDLQGARVVLYSLMAPALGRASRILERRFPGIATQALSAKVANHELRAASRDADVLVIADKAAAHAATDAIKAARGDKPIDYATGRGTVSLVDAAARGLERLGARGAE